MHYFSVGEYLIKGVDNLNRHSGAQSLLKLAKQSSQKTNCFARTEAYSVVTKTRAVFVFFICLNP